MPILNETYLYKQTVGQIWPIGIIPNLKSLILFFLSFSFSFSPPLTSSLYPFLFFPPFFLGWFCTCSVVQAGLELLSSVLFLSGAGITGTFPYIWLLSFICCYKFEFLSRIFYWYLGLTQNLTYTENMLYH